jgi:hypothetical protein
MRQTNGKQVPLRSYLCFQQDPPFCPALWRQLLRGLSTGNYGPSVRRFAGPCGLEQSAASGHFIEASRRKLRELMEHNLAGQFELFAAHGVEHFSGRLSRAFAPSLRPLPPLDQIESGTRVPDPAVALAGQRDELPAAGAEADFLDDANALAKLPRVLSSGVDFLVFTDTPSRSASASDWERAFLLRRGGEGGIRTASGFL